MNNPPAPLAAALEAAVPLLILTYSVRGGPTDADRERAGSLADVLAGTGDALLHRGGKPGATADLFNRLADAVAVLAFQPGGVTLFGVTYTA